MILTRVRLLASLLIVIVLAACDNVQWGGAEVTLVPPPPRAGDAGNDDEDGPRAERVPDGPILYYVWVTDGQAALRPVGEIVGDSLLPIRATADWEVFGSRFISRYMRRGGEFTLLRGGSRVGTFVLRNAGVPDESVCARVPIARGVVELSPAAEGTSEFIALAKPQNIPPGGPLVAEPESRQQRIAPILAEQLLRASNAQLPGDWQRAMAQLRLVPLANSAYPAFVSTFLVGDTLGPGLNNEGHSVFFVAQPDERGAYRVVYSSFTKYEQDGKLAPRVVDFLDWNHDGEAEVLLQVFSTDDAWFEAVGRSGDEWRPIFNDRCQRQQPSPAPAPAADAASDSAPADST